jgi:hypothetical protein
LVVDPYNDFVSEGGKLWPRVQAVAEHVQLLDHLRSVVSVARPRLDRRFRPASSLATRGLRRVQPTTAHGLGL